MAIFDKFTYLGLTNNEGKSYYLDNQYQDHGINFILELGSEIVNYESFFDDIIKNFFNGHPDLLFKIADNLDSLI